MKICRLYRGTALLLSALTLGVLAGCVNDEDYTVNSDGTAKVLISSSGKLNFSNVARYSKGIDAWSDLHLIEEDGKVVSSSVTAYVPDVTAFRLNGVGNLPAFTKKEDGSLQVETRFDIPEDEKVEGVELEGLMEQIRTVVVAQSAHFGSRIKGDGKSAITIRCAGDPKFSSHFKKMEDGSYQITNNILQNMEVMKGILDDEAKLREIASHGKNGSKVAFRAAVSEKVYGTPDAVLFVIPAGGAPLFDYAAEVKAAQEGIHEMMQKSGYFRMSLPEAPANLPLTEVALAHPHFHSNLGTPMVDFRISGQLAEDVVHVGEIELVEVLDAEGKILFPTLSEDGKFKGRISDGKLSTRVSCSATDGESYQKIAMVIPVGQATRSEKTILDQNDLTEPIEGSGLRLTSTIAKMGERVLSTLEWTMEATAPFTIIRIMNEEGKEITSKQLTGAETHDGSHRFHGKEILWAKVEIETFPDYVQVEVPVVLENVPAEK